MERDERINESMKQLKIKAMTSSQETLKEVSNDFCFGYIMSATESLLNDLNLTKKQMSMLEKHFGVR
jgi:Golgi nucleoside diphosphatase